LEELKELRELLDERLYEKLIYSKVKEDSYNKAIQDFTEALIPRLTDAIYQKDVESMRNLINDVVEHLKEGSTVNG
jgi:hypothetical protein